MKSFNLNILIINSVLQPFLSMLIVLNGGSLKSVTVVMDFVCAVILYLCYWYVTSKEGK